MIISLLVIPLRAPTQTPAQRTLVDSVIREVEASHRANSDVDIEQMHHAETAFVDAVERHDRWARAWYGLGIARLELARADVLSREGPLLPIGVGNEAGGENALIRAVQLDHTLAEAANTLALAPTWRQSKSRLKERAVGGRPAYAVMSGPALAAQAYAERESGSIDSAVALERHALQRGGVDSALVLLALARDLFRLKEPLEGKAALLAAASTHTALGQEAYRAELGWVASPAELVQWDSLTPDARPGWVANFWTRRDVAEGRRDGARLEEHYRRIEYAMNAFRITLPKSGRQRSVTMTVPTTDDYIVEDKARKAAMSDPTQYGSAGRLYALAAVIGSESPFRYYQPVQSLINDKGIIWIRHGRPAQTAHNIRGLPFEIWRYNRPEGSLILYFRQVDFEGSSMPNELVPTLLDASPVSLNSICALDQVLCPTASARVDFGVTPDGLDREVRTEGARLSPEALVRSAERGKAFIDLATTTDTYHRDFARALHPSLQVVGLDRAASGEPRMVIAFAIPGRELTGTAVEGRVVYPVQLHFMAADSRNGHRIDVDTLRRFMTATKLGNGQFITGLIEVPVAAGMYSASLLMSQDDGRGALAHLSSIVVPGNARALTLSDLVLGRGNSGVFWQSGTTSVALNPLNTYARGEDADAYFQLSGLSNGASYQLKFELFRSDDNPKQAARLAIAFAQLATAERIEVARTIGLQNLDPGVYRVKLSVSGAGAQASATQWLTIVK